MQFILIICHDDSFGPTPKLIQSILNWNAEAKKKGILVHSNPLMPPSFAKTIRIRKGKTKIVKGTFARTKEFVSAYVIINAKNGEMALKIAESHPMAIVASIEVRPIWQDISGN